MSGYSWLSFLIDVVVVAWSIHVFFVVRKRVLVLERHLYTLHRDIMKALISNIKQ